jgi:ABC-type amino acid transport substrate-binding protein
MLRLLPLLMILLAAEPVTVGRDLRWSRVVLDGREKPVLAFSDELAQEIAKREGLQFHFYDGDWSSIVNALLEEEVDGLLIGLQPLGQYEERLVFSKPYLLTGPVLITREGSPSHSLETLEGKIVGISSGSGGTQIAAEIPLVVIEPYINEAVALNALAKGQVDGVLAPAIPTYAYLVDIYRGVLRLSSHPLDDQGIRFVTLKENEELVEKFNRGLSATIEDGTYQRLQKRWQLHLPPSYDPRIAPAFGR